jgi:hypothetical protein
VSQAQPAAVNIPSEQRLEQFAPLRCRDQVDVAGIANRYPRGALFGACQWLRTKRLSKRQEAGWYRGLFKSPSPFVKGAGFFVLWILQERIYPK